MFGFCRHDCAVVVTVYHSHLPLLFYFQAQGDEKRHPKKKKSRSDVWNFEKQAVHFGEPTCVGASPPQALTAGRFHSLPTQPHKCDPPAPPPPPVTVGINIMPVLGWTCKEAALTQRGVKEHLAGSWGGFFLREGNDRAQSRGKHCSLAGSCGVLDWKHSLILPTAPGHSCFKCSRTKQTKKWLSYCRAGRQMCIDRKWACSGIPALTWWPGLRLQAIISRSNWLSVLDRCACFLKTKKLWRI